jgi:hypothetical protein
MTQLFLVVPAGSNPQPTKTSKDRRGSIVMDGSRTESRFGRGCIESVRGITEALLQLRPAAWLIWNCALAYSF